MTLQTRRGSAIPRMRTAPEASPAVTRTTLPEAGPTTTHRLSWKRGYVAGAVAADVVAGLSATAMGLVARFGHRFPAEYLYGSLALIPLWLTLVAVNRGYDHRLIGVGGHEFTRIMRAGASLMVAVGLLSYATKSQFARGYVLVAIPSLILMSAAGRGIQQMALRFERRHGRCLQRTLIVGTAAQLRSESATHTNAAKDGLELVGACLTDAVDGDHRPVPFPVLGGIADVRRVAFDLGVDAVLLYPDGNLTGPELRRLGWDLADMRVELFVSPGLIETSPFRVVVHPIGHSPVLQISPARLGGPARILKGVFDRTAAATGLLILSPLLLTVAVAIWIGDRGNPIFRQTRIGLNGREFRIWKFRTMVTDAEARMSQLMNADSDALLFKLERDPRITPLGHWLRKYSIDELPQLINVLCGDMSLVGPRPQVAAEVNQYGEDIRRRLLVKPGLTGLWQVSGRSDLSVAEWEMLDLRYVENWSLGTDLMILGKTAKAVLGGSGAY